MKKVIVLDNRLSREYIANPHAKKVNVTDEKIIKRDYSLNKVISGKMIKKTKNGYAEIVQKKITE